MAKQLTDLQQINKQALSADDLMWIRDVSENRDKKASLGDIFGRTLEGWISVVGDNWTFSAYDESSKIGVVSVNAGGLGKYAVGQRVQFTQDDTTKYGIIIAQTDTTLKILMLGGGVLENSDISLAKYSQSFAPQTETGINFFGTLLTGQIDGLPVVIAKKDKESDPDVPPQEGFVVLEMILADE